jgi:hypothetical protein
VDKKQNKIGTDIKGKKEDGVAKLIARLRISSSLGSNPDISQKYAMGDISKGVANTL